MFIGLNLSPGLNQPAAFAGVMPHESLVPCETGPPQPLMMLGHIHLLRMVCSDVIEDALGAALFFPGLVAG